ncbi:hypothetical protein KM043_017660 [Ampulex compressa]|nr:hypothetical protein KM043_017660 [Ampulex compressa]
MEVCAANYNSAWEKLSTNCVRDLCHVRDQASDIRTALLNAFCLINLWGDQFIFIILWKLYSITHQAWALTQKDSSVYPTFGELDEFLSHLLQALETDQPVEPGGHSQGVSPKPIRGVVKAHQASSQKPSCFLFHYDLSVTSHPDFLSSLSLADSDLHYSEPIQVIIGAGYFDRILLDGVRYGALGFPLEDPRFGPLGELFLYSS